jgi:hypothetical protein
MGFAPMNNPKIAICVFVETAGFGAAFGVPIGSLMIEKYINGEISAGRKGVEERMLNAKTYQSVDKKSKQKAKEQKAKEQATKENKSKDNAAKKPAPKENSLKVSR